MIKSDFAILIIFIIVKPASVYIELQSAVWMLPDQIKIKKTTVLKHL